MIHDIFPCKLKHKPTISSIPMCYAKCHNEKKNHLKNLLMFKKIIILATIDVTL